LSIRAGEKGECEKNVLGRISGNYVPSYEGLDEATRNCITSTLRTMPRFVNAGVRIEYLGMYV
jgi:hypothetical protein